MGTNKVKAFCECCGTHCLCGCCLLPDTLSATFTNLEFCGELNGEVITLTWQEATQDYRGSKAMCSPSVTFTLIFYCVVNGDDCTDYRLTLDADDPVCEWTNAWSPEAGCSCDPFECVFEQRLTPPVPPLECGCCTDDDITAGKWRVTITL